MPNLKELNRRIKSIKSTAQVTKAMELISASKMRRAQHQALGGRPYSHTLGEILYLVKDRLDETHPLLSINKSEKRLVILISTNRGQTGALNSNLFRELALNPTPNTDFVALGKKATQFL